MSCNVNFNGINLKLLRQWSHLPLIVAGACCHLPNLSTQTGGKFNSMEKMILDTSLISNFGLRLMHMMLTSYRKQRDGICNLYKAFEMALHYK
jgi:hypothetical protein